MIRLPFLTALLLLQLPLIAADGVSRHTPKGGVSPSTGKVGIEGVSLLDPQELFERNTTVEKLATFIQDVEKNVTRAVPAHAPAFELLVKATLSSSAKPNFDISSKGGVSEAILQKIYDSLEKTTDTRSKADPLRLGIHFVIKAKP